MQTKEYLHTRQYEFLRELRNAEHALPDHAWPRVATLRRWLRHPQFRQALRSLRSTMQFERDWMMSASSSAAARNLYIMLSEQDPRSGVANPDARLGALVRIIRAENLQYRDKHRRPIKRPKNVPPPNFAALKERLIRYAQARGAK